MKYPSTEEIQIAKIKINDIKVDWDKGVVLIYFRVGLESYTITVLLANTYYFPSANSNGLITHLKLMDTDYTLFITSPELNLRLSINSYKADKENTVILSAWFVEIIRSFKNFNIYFIRSVDIGSIWRNQRSPEYQLDKTFMGFYHTDPEDKSDFKKFMLLKNPLGYSSLIEIFDTDVCCHKFEYKLKILIGKFNFENIQGFAYILCLGDLFNIQEKGGFKENIFFQYNNKLIPIPSLPIINTTFDDILEKSDTYTSYSLGSQILCIFISSRTTVNNFHINNYLPTFNQNELIAISDTYYDYSDHSIFRNNLDLMPYKYLIYPYDYTTPDTGFLAELPDYDYEKQLEESKKQSYRGFGYERADNYYELDYMAKLDPSEKYEDDYDRADFEFEEDSYEIEDIEDKENWYTLSLSEKFEIDFERTVVEYRNKSYYLNFYNNSGSNLVLVKKTKLFLKKIWRELIKIGILKFVSRILKKSAFILSSKNYYLVDEFAQKIISNIFFVSINKDTVVFEILRGFLYQTKVCSIVQNKFINGIYIFSGALELENIGDFSFVIAEKCPKKVLRKFLSKVMNYKKYQIKDYNNYYVCFNQCIYKNLSGQSGFNHIAPTLIYR